jgi:hypothetical protein
MTRQALALAMLLALSGCPWDDPCWQHACGATCTWCGADDLACQRANPPYACDAGGACVPVATGTAPAGGPCTLPR